MQGDFEVNAHGPIYIVYEYIMISLLKFRICKQVL
jgi:hypothetical protein